MLENQAFGWLKNAIGGVSTSIGSPSNAAAISACTDPAVLVSGVAQDFNASLLASSSSSSTGSSSSAEIIGVRSDASATAATATSDAATSASANNVASAPTIDTSTSTAPDGGGIGGTTTNDHLDDLTARLDRIKTLLYEERSASSNAVAQNGGSINLNWIPATATGVFKSFTNNGAESSDNNIVEDLMTKLIQNLPLLPFEARKSVSAIFNYLLVCGLDGVDAQQFASVSSAFAAYVLERAEMIIGQLVRAHHCKAMSGGGGGGEGGGEAYVDITLLCGSMLRSSLRHASIYQWMLSDGNVERLVYPFLDGYVHNPNFDISSDALETVRVMFTGAAGGSNAAMGIVGDSASEEHKQVMEGIASDFLNRKYADVIDERINKKCLSSKANYMTRRMSLQLLSTILLNRANYNVMIMYISSSPNLVTILCLLRDPSPHITLDAFQVFKIFVANPNKPPEVVKILFDNKVKLAKYLEGLHKDREIGDEQFRDEKQLVISTLEGLEMP
ncbi:hypothetical protein ACHAXR_010551 [Thalassiosira sp. AJA248-18]